MGKKNRNGGNAGGPARGLNVDLVRRVSSAKEQAVLILRQSGHDEPLPNWDAERFTELHEALPAERRDTLAGLLGGFAELGRKLKDTVDAHRKLNDALRAKAEEADAKDLDFTARELAVAEREEGLLPKEARLADLERNLAEREADARNGFAAQSAAHLAELKAEVESQEAKRDALTAAVAECERALREGEAAKTAAIEAVEAALAVRERRVDALRRRVEAEVSELEDERVRLREEARREAQAEIENLRDAKERALESAKRAFDQLGKAEGELDALEDFRAALGNRDPHSLLDELVGLRRRARELEAGAADLDHEGLRVETLTLRGERDALRAQLDGVGRELAEKTEQLNRLRLGVSDRESLEREKRALEKHVQALTLRLNALAAEVDELGDRQRAPAPFPQLASMDSDPDMGTEPKLREVKDLKVFADELRHRIARSEPGVTLFYGEREIRLLLAGLAMSQLHILQGVSGTGKTSLVKAFAKAVGGNCTDIAVQAGWRDRDDLLGHYNAFEARFYEKDCLQGLYMAQTPAHRDRVNVILLDEMNLSRPEQYFAEFLSAIEKNDPRHRLITLSERALPGAPSLLVEARKVRVPSNVWFFGTANHDETTNELADKTYDRAHVQELPRIDGNEFEPRELQDAAYSSSSLQKRFGDAADDHAGDVDEMLEAIYGGPLTKTLKDRFGVEWGNRLGRQARAFVPVYFAAGGAPEEALDHLLASRVLRRGKVTGRYDATQEDLKAVEDALLETFRRLGDVLPEACVSLIEADSLAKGRGA